jgi:protein O-mannosyl-transferase
VGAIAAAVWVCYANSLTAPFFFDDNSAIAANPSIRDLGNLRAVLSPPADGSGATGRPIVNLSLAINYASSGNFVRGYHATNVLLHTLAALALFGWVRRTLPRAGIGVRDEDAALGPAFLIALLWALHPLQTESVTCIIQRTEVLVGLFFLVTLYAFARAADGERGWRWLAVGACALGMASKEVMVVAPLLVLLYDRTFFAGSFRAAWQQRRGLHLALATTWILLAWLVLQTGGTRGQAAGLGLGVTPWAYLLKQCDAIVRYVGLSFWPSPLVVFYGTDVIQRFREVAPQFIALTVTAVATGFALWRYPVMGFVGAWFFAILAPSSSVIPLITQTMAEHRMYLPVLAPLALLVVALHRISRRALWLAGLAAAVAAGLLVIHRNQDYQSQLRIWSDTVVKRPAVAGAHLNLGAAWKDLGRYENAMREFETARTLDPNQSHAYNNIASLLLETGRPDEARAAAQTALRLRPDFAAAHNNLGSALIQTGHPAEGAESVKTALRLDPNLAPAHSNLAGVLLRLGRPAEALTHARRALELQPDSKDAAPNLVAALFALGRVADAVAPLTAFLQRNPQDATAHSNLGAAFFQLGRLREAIAEFEAAVRLRPDFADAHANLGSALLQINEPQPAIQHYRAALRLRPNDADTHANLGLALLRTGDQPGALAEFETALRLKPDHPTARANVSALRGPAASPAPAAPPSP